MRSNTRQVEIPYVPREHFIPFHNRTQRWAVLVCHRRMGKTVACIADLAIRALYSKKKNPRYSYICPTYSQAKDVAWTYLKEMVEGIAVDVRESELRVVLPNGAWVTLYGSDNPSRLRGLYADGIILDEYGDCRPSLWGEILLPSLLDRDGYCVFIGTPHGLNHFYHMYERAVRSDDWYSFKMGAEESGILSEKQLATAKREYAGRESEYNQEMLVSFHAAIKGAYYADMIAELENQGRMCQNSLYDATQPVHAACDLGYSDSSAFWFWQARPDGIALIDYYESAGQNLQHYFDMLDGLKYKYDTIWLPHDARAKSLQTGRSTIEQFLEKKYPVRIAPRLAVQHGIDAVRSILPKMYFDAEKTADGIEALRAYKRRFDEINQVYLDKPLHNHASNGADAFRYLSLVATVDGTEMGTKESRNARRAMNDTLPLTLKNLFQTNEAKNNSISRRRI